MLGCRSVRVCVSHACSASGGHKRASDPLELQLQTIRTILTPDYTATHCHMGVRNQTLVFQKSSQSSELLRMSPFPTGSLVCPSRKEIVFLQCYKFQEGKAKGKSTMVKIQDWTTRKILSTVTVWCLPALEYSRYCIRRNNMGVGDLAQW